MAQGVESGETPFLLSGDRASVSGLPSTGIDEIRIHPFRVGGSFHSNLPAPETVEISPGAVRRRIPPREVPDDPIPESPISIEGSPLVESVVVLHRLPGVVLQWQSPEPREWRAGWTLSPAARAELPQGPAGPLFIVPEADAEPFIRVDVIGAEGRWEIGSSGEARSEASGGSAGDADAPPHVSLRVGSSGGDPVTLLFSLDSEDEMQRTAVTRRVSSLAAELSAWANADARADHTELHLSLEDPDAAVAFQWARRSLHAAVGHTGDGAIVLVHPDPTESPAARMARMARVGHGLLALGRHREAGELAHQAASLLREPWKWERPSRPGEHESEDGRPGASGVPGLLLFIARYVLWTADTAPLRRIGKAPEEWLTRLVGPGSPAISTAPAPGSPPTVGSAAIPEPPPAEALWIAVSEWAEALEAAGERSRGEELRTLLKAVRTGGEEEDQGRPGTRRREEDPVETHPAHLLFHLLGARADAFFGRLRLAPRIPDGWRRMTVGSIRMGDGSMGLSYHVEEARHTFRLEPTGGRVPMNLVLEPLLAVRSLDGAYVDGSPADLDRFRQGDRMGARLQLPLDASREVVFEEGG